MSKNNNQMVTFKKGKESRNQLELPTLHFIVTDQWTDVLSEKAIFAWLRMYSWCKRDEKDSDIDLWEQSKIPFSFKSVQKKLKVGSDTFYNKILKPLWNVGLIDIEEYEQSENKGTKPMNIIVYKYPQNNKALAYEPIKEIRNYDVDYHSEARTFAKKGGRPKKQGGSEIEHPQKIGGSETEHPPVLNENTPPFQNRTPPRSKIEHINSLNNINNNLNNISNNFNDINNELNYFEEEEEINNARENNIAYEILDDFLKAKGIDQKTIDKTILELMKRDLDLFLMENVEQQYEHMMEKLKNGEVDNHNGFAVYFANGLQMRSVQSKASKNYQVEKMREYEEAMRERKERLESSKLYNWLED